MLVDLLTLEKDLEDLMLSEYPGILKEEQIVKSKKGERKVYSFFGLEYEELTSFLAECKGYNFWIFEHTTKRFIEDNREFINHGYYH